MTTSMLHASVTTYRGNLVLELRVQTHEGMEPHASSLAMPGLLAQTVVDTARTLGISPEALAVLQAPRAFIKGSPVNCCWKRDYANRECFTWRGGPWAFETIGALSGPLGTIGRHVVIANETSPRICQHIDKTQAFLVRD